MKKKLLLCFLFIFSFIIITGCKNKEFYITDNEILYSEAVKYIIDNDDNPDNNKDRYKMFTDYEEFGITEDEQYRYVYMWIAEESYYVEDEKIMSSSGISMPYKFIFDLKDNKVVKYETPRDGSEYVPSIREMFPDDIEDKVIQFQWKDNSLIKEVKEYYSDIEDKNIYYDTGEEYIIIDK